jgi:hypothetical protein
MALSGSCLCGGIRYEIDGELRNVLHCHCSMCRKAHGAAFRTRASVSRANFRWMAGEDLLSGYESSPGNRRIFCRVCGSPLASFFADRPESMGLALGTLDADPNARPKCHVFVGSKAPWYEITDDLPQYHALAPARRGS